MLISDSPYIPGDRQVALFFPPFSYSSINGPHLAPALLAAILNKSGIFAHTYDLNIRFINAITERDFIDNISPSVFLDGDSSRKEREILRAIKNKPWFSALKDHKYAFRIVLNKIIESNFSQPTSLESLNGEPINIPTLRMMIYKQLLSDIGIDRFKYIGLSIAFGEQIPESLMLGSIIKDIQPDICLVAGGSQINLLSDNQLDSIANKGIFDFIVVGNAEPYISDIFRNPSAYISKERSEQNPSNIIKLPPIKKESMQNLPTPLFNTDEFGLYHEPRTLPVLATKGCYWAKCTFCDYAKMNVFSDRKYITRNPQEVFEELRELDLQYSPNTFLLISDGISPPWYRKLSRFAIDNKHKLKTWSYMLHSPHLDESFFCQLREAGVKAVNFGSETTCDRLLRKMNKLGCREDIFGNIRNAKKAGLDVVMNIIIDFPTITFQEAINVVDDMLELKEYVALFNPQLFDLSSDTEIAKHPEKYCLVVNNKELKKTSHGYHGMEFTRTGGLSLHQRHAICEMFGNIASRQKLTRRIEKLNIADNIEAVICLDRSIIFYEEDNHLIDILSLRLVWIVPKWEWILLQKTIANKGHILTLGGLFELWKEERRDCDFEHFKMWYSRIVELGLIESIENT